MRRLKRQPLTINQTADEEVDAKLSHVKVFLP